MKKIIIIGSPGSGKSTFARQLSKKINVPLYHLDLLNWNADKTVVNREIFINRLLNILNSEAWIIDGNYGNTLEVRVKECDTIFFLDLPVDVCLNSIEERKGKARPDMPWIEEDNTDPEFLEFVKRYPYDSRPQVLALMKAYQDKAIFVFKSREEVNNYLMKL
ncbi:AAA family ATPase [Macrococcus equi]|uniref:AAA family ATPase n=1 Tax=Macrococcus equi TaxID=3395462 RepID=UPI0039BEBFB1